MLISYFFIAFITAGLCGSRQRYWDRETFFYVVGVTALWPVALVWDVLLWLEGEL